MTELDQADASDAIPRSIVALAEAMKLTVVAEGIETVQAMRRLAEMGCELGQGYLFSRPVSATRFADLLRIPSGHLFETGDLSSAEELSSSRRAASGVADQSAVPSHGLSQRGLSQLGLSGRDSSAISRRPSLATPVPPVAADSAPRAPSPQPVDTKPQRPVGFRRIAPVTERPDE